MKRKHPKKARMASAKTVERKATQAINEIVRLENMGYHIPIELQNKMYELRNNPTKQQMTTLTRETSPEYIQKHAYKTISKIKHANTYEPVHATSKITAYDIETHPLATINKMLHQEVTNPSNGVRKNIHSYSTEVGIRMVLKDLGYDLNNLQPGYDTDYFRIDKNYDTNHPEDIQLHIKFKNKNIPLTDKIKSAINQIIEIPYSDENVYKVYRANIVDANRYESNLLDKTSGKKIIDDQAAEDLAYILNNTYAWRVAQKELKYEAGDRDRYQELVTAVAEGYHEAIITNKKAEFLDAVQQYIDNKGKEGSLEKIKELIADILKERK